MNRYSTQTEEPGGGSGPRITKHRSRLCGQVPKGSRSQYVRADLTVAAHQQPPMGDDLSALLESRPYVFPSSSEQLIDPASLKSDAKIWKARRPAARRFAMPRLPRPQLCEAFPLRCVERAHCGSSIHEVSEPAIVGNTSQRKLSASFLVSKNPVAPSGFPADEARQGQELLATDSFKERYAQC
jgi:hypothetical protein